MISVLWSILNRSWYFWNDELIRSKFLTGWKRSESFRYPIFMASIFFQFPNPINFALEQISSPMDRCILLTRRGAYSEAAAIVETKSNLGKCSSPAHAVLALTYLYILGLISADRCAILIESLRLDERSIKCLLPTLQVECGQGFSQNFRLDDPQFDSLAMHLVAKFPSHLRAIRFEKSFLDHADANAQILLPARNENYRQPTQIDETKNLDTPAVTIPPFQLLRLEAASILNRQVFSNPSTVMLLDQGAYPLHFSIAGFRGVLIPLSREGSKNLFYFNRLGEREIARGFLLLGRVSKNYFHWLVEYLPKLLALQMKPELNSPEIPILIENNLPHPILEAIAKIKESRGFRNPIVEIGEDENVRVGELWAPTNPCSIPDRFDQPLFKMGAISREHVLFLRESIMDQETSADGAGARHIFLDRTSVGRNVINRREIRKIAEDLGFEIVVPEKLTFLEQVKIFAQADVIVGAGGASFSNLVFAKAGAKALAFVSSQNADFPVFAKLAQIVGAEFFHLTGKPKDRLTAIDSIEAHAHLGYYISPSAARAAMLSLISKV